MPRKLHKVLCPNGVVIKSQWYTHPWLAPSGNLRPYPAASRNELRAIEKAYIEWRNNRAAKTA